MDSYSSSSNTLIELRSTLTVYPASISFFVVAGVTIFSLLAIYPFSKLSGPDYMQIFVPMPLFLLEDEG